MHFKNPDSNAWTASVADYSQYIEIDLGDPMNVTAIATQGRKDSQEFVTAYTISFGQDGTLFSQVKDFDGSLLVS